MVLRAVQDLKNEARGQQRLAEPGEFIDALESEGEADRRRNDQDGAVPAGR